ncbi:MULTISPECIES: NAD(P)-dependent oxidoreductase [Streptomyces]|uniref:NAD(P)-dependent oxidoreductase n=1 Tax=Streptomyces TaxID=1883 RepID=UPI000BF1F92C|nr:NAD(P)-binding domain-containing protein [Streptomyces sp. wa1063]
MAGDNRSPVTVIGLGLMGTALAGALLSAGHPTTVWNRTPEKADDLVERGARRAASVAEAVAASPLTIVCVSTYEVTHELLDPLGEALAGRVVVNLVSGTPGDARRSAEWAAKLGVPYLDGAIMAVPQLIGTPQGLLFYGGPQELYDAHASVLQVFGGQTTYLGEDFGAPLVYDLALLTMLYGAGYGWVHAQALINSAGIPASAFQPFAQAWTQHVILPGVGDLDHGRAIDQRDYATEVSNLNTNRLALSHVIGASEEAGIPVDALTPLRGYLDALVAEGHGLDGFARVWEKLRPAAD